MYTCMDAEHTLTPVLIVRVLHHIDSFNSPQQPVFRNRWGAEHVKYEQWPQLEETHKNLSYKGGF